MDVIYLRQFEMHKYRVSPQNADKCMGARSLVKVKEHSMLNWSHSLKPIPQLPVSLTFLKQSVHRAWRTGRRQNVDQRSNSSGSGLPTDARALRARCHSSCYWAGRTLEPLLP